MSNTWKHPNFICNCGGCDTCCYVACCTACARGRIAERGQVAVFPGNPCCAATFAYMTPFAPLFRCLDRQSLERSLNIKTSCLGACCSTILCAICTDAQEYDEFMNPAGVGSKPRAMTRPPRPQLIIVR